VNLIFKNHTIEASPPTERRLPRQDSHKCLQELIRYFRICVLTDAYSSIGHVNKVVGHAILTKTYLGHIGRKIWKHFSRVYAANVANAILTHFNNALFE